MKYENEVLRDISPTAIRMPSSIKEKIRESAKDHNRSMSAEIVSRLEDSFKYTQMVKLNDMRMSLEGKSDTYTKEEVIEAVANALSVVSKTK